MGMIALPRRHLVQPQYPAPIDYSGLAKGANFLFNPSLGPVDLVTKRIWTPNGNTSVTTGRKGKNFSLDGVDDYLSYTGYPELTSNTGTFAIWCPVVGSSDDFGHVLLGSASPGAVAFQVNQLSQVQVQSSGLSAGSISWFNSTNRSLVFSSGGTAASCKAYLDGRDTGLTFPSTPVAWGSGDKTINLGRYPGGVSWDFSGSILVAFFTSAVWSETEAKAFHQNPWQLFQAPSRKIFVTSSAPSGDSVGSASGSATVSGVGASTAQTDGSASGASSASGAGVAEFRSVGSASGIATVSGVGTSGTGSSGTASGNATVTGGGAATAASSGSANGVASVNGIGALVASTTGTANGSSAVSGVGDSSIPGATVGTANGTSSASGVGASVVSATGSASGSSSASGVAEGAEDSPGGDDGILIYEEPKKKRKPRKRLEDILEDAVRSVVLKAEKQKPVAKPKAVKVVAKKEVIPSPVLPDTAEQLRVAEEEALKVSALLAQYQEQVRRREMDEDEELLMLIAMEMM